MPLSKFETGICMGEVDVRCDLALMAWADFETALAVANSPVVNKSITLRIWYSRQAFLAACANISRLC
jgi:hypothetical protein